MSHQPPPDEDELRKIVSGFATSRPLDDWRREALPVRRSLIYRLRSAPAGALAAIVATTVVAAAGAGIALSWAHSGKPPGGTPVPSQAIMPPTSAYPSGSPLATGSTPAPTATPGTTPHPTSAPTPAPFPVVYPVAPAPPPPAVGAVVVGTSAVQPSPDNDNAQQAEAFSYVASGSGAVRTLGIYLDSNNAAPEVQLGLYSDSAGSPGNLLVAGTMLSPKSGAWNTVAVNGPAVTAGTHYWIALLGEGGTINFRDVNNGAPSQTSSQSLGDIPPTWQGNRSYSSSPASLYAATGPLGAPAPSGPPAVTHFDFESGGTDGWFAGWSNAPWTVGNTTVRAFSGGHSLNVHVNGTGFPNIMNMSGNYPGLVPGRTLTFHIYSPAAGVSAQPTMQYIDSGGAWQSVPSYKYQLNAGWNTVTLVIPPQVTSNIVDIGVQLGAYQPPTMDIQIDAVGW